MHRLLRLFATLTAVLLAVAFSSAVASAKATLHVTVKPTVVSPGQTVRVTVRGGAGATCKVTSPLAGVRGGIKTRSKYTVPASTRAGTVRVSVRCGKRTTSVKIAVKAAAAPAIPGAAASVPISEEGGKGSLGGDYPDADAVDCSRQFGTYSWCKGGKDISSRGYGYRNCTDYAAWVLGLPRGLGNANTWKARAAQGGLSVKTSPAVGDVAWWGGGDFGHVAVVTALYPSGAVDTVDYNGDGRGNKTIRQQTRADAYLHPAQAPAVIDSSSSSSAEVRASPSQRRQARGWPSRCRAWRALLAVAVTGRWHKMAVSSPVAMLATSTRCRGDK